MVKIVINIIKGISFKKTCIAGLSTFGNNAAARSTRAFQGLIVPNIVPSEVKKNQNHRINL